MAFESELEDLFIHEVTLKPYPASITVDGKPTYGAGATHKAKIVLETRYIRSADGRQIAGRGTVYIKATAVPGVKDELTMPAGFEPATPPILDVRPHYDDEGLHHVELVIG